MDVTLLKLVVTPSLMFAVSTASRRWGSAFAGLLSGLPLTSAPVSAFLAVEQGPRFAAASAVGSIAGMSAVMASYVAYLVASRRVGAGGAAPAALAAYVAMAWCTGHVGHRLWPLVLLFVAGAALVLLLAQGAAVARAAPPPRWDMPARLCVSTGMLLAITAAAPLLGPTVTGVLAPMPVISWPLIAFAHVQGDRAQACAVIRGTTQTSLGILAFYLVVMALVEAHEVWAYVAGVAAATALAAPWFWLDRRSRRAAARHPSVEA